MEKEHQRRLIYVFSQHTQSNERIGVVVKNGKCFLSLPNISEPMIIPDGWETEISLQLPDDSEIQVYAPWRAV